MAKTKAKHIRDTTPAPMSDGFEAQRTWANHHGTYIAGRAHIDAADAAAIEAEERWGCGRLRLLVSPELREKFDRQRYLLNRAIWHGDLEAVRRESGRMVTAWRALNQAATAAGHDTLPREVWEIARPDGKVVAIVQDDARARMVRPEGRYVDIYTLEEIGRLLEGFPLLAKVKETFPGATVTAVRRRIEDPLDTIGDTRGGLDTELYGELSDDIPF